ncbi:universal stress protein [Nocardioides ferulae]|uniref:universal stress protein n=1 Tax=Nocardioides ferulae TaxID=2340821 RepID=UPI0013DDC7F4|nr:universal stress protein [Nocardioides ferulae]
MIDHTPRPVVVAVARDGSESALRFAATEARRGGCGLHLVHAVDVTPSGPRPDPKELDRADHLGTATLRLAAARAEVMLDGAALVTSSLVHGSAVDAVVDASIDAGLVVLGRRPSNVLRRVVTRSISSGVAARAHVPVVSVPDGWTEFGDKRVTVGLDVPDHSRSILRKALHAGRSRGATVNIVHTWWIPSGYDEVPSPAVQEEWSARARHEIEGVLSKLQGDYDVPVEIDVRHGKPADALIEASHRSDLIVVGRHDPVIPLGSHLGPVARAVLRDADCPVLLVAPTQAHRMATWGRGDHNRPVQAV